MKKRNWIYVVLIALCVGVLALYLAIDRIRTDRRAPEITFGTEAPAVSVLDPASAFLQGVTAKDNTDGDVTSSLVVESVKLVNSNGDVNVTYAAFDSAGNVAKAQQQFRYADYESPRFSVNRSLAFAQNTNTDLFQIATATDMVEGDISHRIRITSLDQTSLSSLGNHEVELRVSNSLGDTVSLVVPVEVYSAGSYSAAVELTDYLVYVPAGSTFRAKDYLSSFSYSGEQISLKDGVPDDYSLYISGEVDTDVPGVYPVGYRITKLSGTADNPGVGYTKLIVVVEG